VFDIEGTAVRVASGGSPPGKAPTSTSSLVRVTKALRHLIASAEPALVFAHVAAICVPTVCDRCVIDISEGGASTYRIRRPGGFWSIDDVDESDLGAGAAAPDRPVNDPSPADRSMLYRLGFGGSGGNPAGGGFTGVMTCTWSDAARPNDVDRRVLQLIVDYACAVVEGAARRTADGPPSMPGIADLATPLVPATRRQAADAVAAITAVHHRTANVTQNTDLTEHFAVVRWS